MFITAFMLMIIPYIFQPLIEDELLLHNFRSFIFSLIWIPFITILSNLIFRIGFFLRDFPNYFCAKGCLILINEGKMKEDGEKAILVHAPQRSLT